MSTLSDHVSLGKPSPTMESVAFAGATRNLIVASGAEGILLSKWEASSGNVIFQTLPDRNDGVRKIKLSSDGARILRTTDVRPAQDGLISHFLTGWETGSLKKVLDVKVPGEDEWATDFEMSRNGERVWTGTTNELSLWDINEPDLIRKLKRTYSLSRLIASPSGQWFAESYGAGTRLYGWDGNDGQSSHTLLAFSPDDRLALAGSVNRVTMTEVPSNRELWEQTNLSNALIGIFSPRGDFVAAGDYEQIALRSTATGRLLKTLTGHNSNPVSLSITEDGQLLAALCRDGLIRLW